MKAAKRSVRTVKFTAVLLAIQCFTEDYPKQLEVMRKSALPLTSPQFPFSREMILHHTQSNVSFSQLLHKNVPLCSNGLTATYFADEFADSIGELGQSLGVFSVLGLYLFFLKA